MEIITEHDQDVQMFINDQHGRNNNKAEQLKLEQQHGQVDWGQQGVIMSGSPGACSKGSGPPRERKKERRRELENAHLDSHRTPNRTGEVLQI